MHTRTHKHTCTCTQTLPSHHSLARIRTHHPSTQLAGYITALTAAGITALIVTLSVVPGFMRWMSKPALKRLAASALAAEEKTGKTQEPVSAGKGRGAWVRGQGRTGVSFGGH